MNRFEHQVPREYRPGISFPEGPQNYGERKCSCCDEPFVMKSAVQRTSTRAYCDKKLCQMYKERKLWQKPKEIADRILGELKLQLEEGKINSTPKWKRHLLA